MLNQITITNHLNTLLKYLGSKHFLMMGRL